LRDRTFGVIRRNRTRPASGHRLARSESTTFDDWGIIHHPVRDAFTLRAKSPRPSCQPLLS